MSGRDVLFSGGNGVRKRWKYTALAVEMGSDSGGKRLNSISILELPASAGQGDVLFNYKL
ncbi:MAG: hypothetical protein GTO45_40685 [Candidatus Aminicenantes bacterium]|nr:hypothetical protein [Candidatus Aminicenantes bacterium]NIM84921.1 hypothetical protein [Candidatus Aminicenantes bacterium]NIN24435.1 hypothetical protein [Candidatus Aminicenantes bacterium]NIN48199.1 hypothetical protein [Candidatus Aminicenantes bacterium]NIN91102.1 hypothetical protein [Candidatus Aminicenantes bacterium]